MSDRRRNSLRPADRPRPDRRRRRWRSIVTKPTKLGLDLQGGVQLVYQGKPTKQQPAVNAEALAARARHHARPRRRLRRRRARSSSARARPDRGQPARRRGRRARRAPGRHDRPAVLLRLGAERPRRGLQDQPTTESTAASSPITGLYNAVKRRVQVRAGGRPQQHHAPVALLRVRQGSKKPLNDGIPDETRAEALAASTPREQARRPRSSRSRGRARPARREAAADDRRRDPDRGGSSATTPGSPAPTSRTRSRTSTSAGGNEPIVTFEFTTRAARRSRRRRADRPARRRQRLNGGHRPGGRLAALRDRARQRARSRRRSSTSARTRTASTARPARRSPAASRSSAPGPREPPQDRRAAAAARADLALAGLGDARQAGARPGPQSPGLAGFVIVALFLLVFYRVLGVIAVLALASTRSTSSR